MLQLGPYFLPVIFIALRGRRRADDTESVAGKSEGLRDLLAVSNLRLGAVGVVLGLGLVTDFTL